MADFKQELISHYGNGTLLDAVYQRIVSQPEKRSGLAAELAQLHNDNAINLIDAFMSLKASKGGSKFFLIRDIFEQALPELVAPTQPVMHCVRHLFAQAGADGAAGLVLHAFSLFCERQVERSREAIAIIEKTPSLSVLLSPAIVAGVKTAESIFLSETFRLMKHENEELRKAATFALGRAEWTQSATLGQSLKEALSVAIHKGDNVEVVGIAVSSCARLIKASRINLDEGIALCFAATADPHRTITNACAETFLLLSEALSEDQNSKVMSRILADPSAANLSGMVDHGVFKMLEGGRIDQAIAVLELVLAANPAPFPVDVLKSSVHLLTSNSLYSNKVATRWLLSGSIAMGKAVGRLFNQSPEHAPLLEISPSEIDLTDSIQVRFLARKIVGFLFHNPVSAASMILSLMRHSPSDRQVLADLLYEPLLINYTGSVRRFVADRIEKESEPLSECLTETLAKVESYLAELRKVGDVPELWPSETHRVAARKNMQTKMEGQMQEAQKQSVLMQFTNRMTILYGRKAVSHGIAEGGRSRRIETKMNEFSVEFEIPRKELLDPVGLSILLILFRAEQRPT